MRKIFIINLILIILTIFITTSCSNKNKTKEQQIVNSIQKQSNIGTNNMDNFDLNGFISNIKQEYKNEEQFNYCIKNNISMCLNQIISNKANEKQDETICDDINDKNIANGCKTGIIIAKAINSGSGNINMCNKLEGYNKDTCVFEIFKHLAIKNKDLSFCDNIKSSENNTNSGDKLSLGNQATPNMMFNDKQGCINNLAFQIAISENNTTYCAKINDKMMKQGCIITIKSQIENKKNMP